MAEHKAFPGKTCARLRRLNEIRTAARSKRADLFQSRDATEEQLHATRHEETKKRENLTRDYGTVVLELKRLNHAIKGIESDVFDTIANGDQGKLWEDGDVQLSLEDYLAEANVIDDDEGDVRPVGRPGSKPKPEAPDPSKGDGVDEHLKASVKELDMPERLIGLCEKAGLTKIVHLVKVLDDNDGDAPSLGEAVNGSDKDAKEIAKAVKVYRDKHRKAAMKAEGIES